ncbi:hypothetical protein QA648_27400 (plasmid) [Rhizobium sp. CB3171]|uniref:hypothetical protein n=1 Tax=Rhizobium sp. CB3171 TaxID=3039157 RepID=UPI0024B26278|nr:hypothetical protein [Rhizobium sp. CB3171]WFU04511.1 hypothetical protein QA648_27400 [Rhizobium sp. CB3171]
MTVDTGKIETRLPPLFLVEQSDNELIDELLKVLRFSEECGSIANMQRQIARYEPFFNSIASEEQRNEYNSFRDRLREYLAYEEQYGTGSLLNLSHPFIRQQICRGAMDVRRVLLWKAPKVAQIFR